MDTRWRNIIVGIFLLGGIIATYYIVKGFTFKQILSFFGHFNIGILALYICTVFILFITLTWRWDVILKSRNAKIPFAKLFVYRIIGISINFLTPGPRVGGEPTQATLLTKHGVDFTEGLSTIMIDKIIDTTTNGLLFIVGVFLIGLKYTFSTELKILLTAGGGLFVLLVFLFYYRMLTSRHFFLKVFHIFRLHKIEWKPLQRIIIAVEKIELIMMEFYREHKKHFIGALAISIFTWVLMFFEYKWATTLLGLHLGIVEMFFIITFIGIAMLFPIPMAVGVLEAGQISAFAIINLPASAGVALAFLVRMKDLTVAIIGLILLSMFGFHVAKVVEKKYTRKPINDKNS